MKNRQEEIRSKLESFTPELLALRQTLHENPELGMQEYDTTKFLRETLEGIGIEVLPSGLETGLIAVIHGRSGKKCAALRADIDALPVTEAPWAGACSKRPGVMHACGHDAHMGSLLGAAYVLQQMRNDFCGDVLLVFQPGEEPCRGAQAVLETGILQQYQPAAMFGSHVYPGLPEGVVGLRPGSAMAALITFGIKITGKGAHAAMPQYADDPIIAGTAVITALQTIASRRMSPTAPFVLSICSVHAGTTNNIIPDEMEIKGTLRFADESMRGQIMQWLNTIVKDTASAHGCAAEVDCFLHVPAVTNAPALYPVAAEAARKTLGEENVREEGFWMVSEDFGYYNTVTPSWFYFSGCATEEMTSALHSPLFHASDRTMLNTARLLAQSALDVLDAE